MNNWITVKSGGRREILKSKNNKCIVFVMDKYTTGLTTKWYELTDDIVPNAIIAYDVSEMPNSFNTKHFIDQTYEMLMLSILPVSVVVSAQAFEYRYKNSAISYEEAVNIIKVSGFYEARKYADQMKEYALKMYHFCHSYAFERGLELKKARFKFGTDQRGKLRLADEICTPYSACFFSIKKQEVVSDPAECYSLLFE